MCEAGPGSRAGPAHCPVRCAPAHALGSCAFARAAECAHDGGMVWTTPAYEELKMDAEIGSYQQDEDVPPFAAPAPAARPSLDAAE